MKSNGGSQIRIESITYKAVSYTASVGKKVYSFHSTRDLCDVSNSLLPTTGLT